MEQTTHTPGPWGIKNVGNVYTSTGPVVQAGKKRIAKIAGIHEEDYANAQLIAAAPDYDDGAREAVPWLDLIKQNYPEMTSLISGLTKLKAAIAKATGK